MLTILQDNEEIRARDHREPGHFWADKEIVENYLPQIGVYGFSVYMMLAYHARSSTGRCWPAIGTLAKKLGISEPTVRKALETLIEAGLILVSDRSYTSKRGKKVHLSYVYTLREVDKGVVNDVYQGGKPDLPGVVNDVYPNNNNINKNNRTTPLQPSQTAAGSQPLKVEGEKGSTAPQSSSSESVTSTPSTSRGKRSSSPRQPSIDQCVKDEVAKHIQGIDPKLGTSLTGVLAQLAVGVWRKHFGIEKLSANQYQRIARSILAFVQWYHQNCKDCSIPQAKNTFENWYTKFVAVTVGKTVESEIDDLDLDWMRTVK